jgi:hypothetical protein
MVFVRFRNGIEVEAVQRNVSPGQDWIAAPSDFNWNLPRRKKIFSSSSRGGGVGGAFFMPSAAAPGLLLLILFATR